MEELGDNVFFRISSTDNLLGLDYWWCWQQHKPFKLSRKPMGNVFSIYVGKTFQQLFPSHPEKHSDQKNQGHHELYP